MWVVSIYIYITFSRIRRSVCDLLVYDHIPVYEYENWNCPFFLSTVSCGFPCTNLSLHKEPFVLPCLGPLESGMGKMGSWREWMFLLPLCTYSLVTCSIGALGHTLYLCLQMSLPTGNFLWIWVFILLSKCPQGLSQCLACVLEPQVYLHMNEHIRPSHLLQ